MSNGKAPQKEKIRWTEARLQAAVETARLETEERASERLSEYLKRQWAWGHISPQTVQAIASHAIGDMKACGLTDFPPLLAKFAALGTNGQHANNMHKELLHMLEQNIHVPQPLMLKLPFAKGDFLQSIMLPHVVFAHLHQFYPAAFQRQFLPQGIGHLKEFWRTFKMHPCMEGHEIFHRPNFDTSILPLHIHGDAVPITGKGKVWCKMMLAFSWTGALSRSNSQEACNFIYGATRLHISSGSICCSKHHV